MWTATSNPVSPNQPFFYVIDTNLTGSRITWRWFFAVRRLYIAVGRPIYIVGGTSPWARNLGLHKVGKASTALASTQSSLTLD